MNGCTECGRQTGHKLDCSRGRADALDGIPAESLAVYVERIADVLQAEGEDRVNDLYPGTPYGAIWAELASIRRLDLPDIERIDAMAEKLHANRRAAGR